MAIENIVVPDIGGAEKVDVIEVLVKAGDAVEIDTPLITLESDKATMEVPSPQAGIVQELKVHVGDQISQGSVILTLSKKNGLAHSESTRETKKSEKPQTSEEKPPKKSEKTFETSTEKSFSSNKKTSTSESVQTAEHAGPAVRKLARELGVDLSHVAASGPKNRILKEDIEQFVKTKLAQLESGGIHLPTTPVIDFAQFGPIESKPLSRLKKISGKNLHRNWTLVPHVTQFGEADITELEAFRQMQKASFEKQNLRLTPLIFIMKAVVSTLKKYPQFNASLDQTGEQLIYKNYFHIGVAVDTPEGLVVPVIRNVDQKNLTTLAKELGEISEKARKKQLLPQDMQGGCFSISSLGGIGGAAFTPIVNVPEVAILGVSKSFYKPIYQNNEFIPRLILPLSLSYDHRVIDGADAARFIEHISWILNDIRNSLI